jgi:Lhr-like helicase
MARSACILGETVDMSRSGLGFIVPSIRVKEKYLVNQDRRLNIELDLPTGKVQLKAVGTRYKKVGIHISTERFLVGVKITSLSGDDKEIYESFLRHGSRRAKASAASLELGID